MTHGTQDDLEEPKQSSWMPAGDKCGAEAMNGKESIFVQRFAGTAYKYLHVATIGDRSYYTHKTKTQRDLVFRKVLTFFVTLEAGAISNKMLKFKARSSMSGNMLGEVGVPDEKAATVAYLKQELQRVLVFNEHISPQTKLVLVPLVSGRARVHTAFEGIIANMKHKKPKKTVKDMLK